MTDELIKRRRLLFGIRRSIRYHNERRRFFGRLHTSFLGLTLLLGAVAAYISQFGEVSKLATPVIGFTIMTVAIFNLVLRVSDRASEHRDLAQRFYVLRKEITLVEDPTGHDLAMWKDERLDIEKDEPPILRVLNAIMHNRTLIAMRLDPKEKRKQELRIGRFQKLLAPFMDVKPDSITYILENETDPHGEDNSDADTA